MNRCVYRGRIAGFALLLLSTAGAHAQSTAPGFMLNRHEPGDPGSVFFSTDSLSHTGHGTFAAGLQLDYAYRPLVLYRRDGSSNSVVRHQAFAHAGIGVALWEDLRLSVLVPIELDATGDTATGGGIRYATESGGRLGDVTVGATMRVWGRGNGGFRAGTGVHVALPTGSKPAFAGDGHIRVRLHAGIAGDHRGVSYAAGVFFHYRGLDGSYADAPLGHEAGARLAVGRRFLDGRLFVGPEAAASTVVRSTNTWFQENATPFEVLFGGKYRLPRDFIVGVAAGPGLTRGLGSPRARLLLSLEWAPTAKAEPIPAPAPEPPAPPPAPTVAPETGPVPPPAPQPDPPSPPPAPPTDADGDDIPDAEDACPGEAGPRSETRAKNGCPVAIMKDKQIVILERIEFDSDRATLRPESTQVLEAVLGILLAHNEISQVTVEGHTDNRGGKAHNKDLSQRRAAAVCQWLVGKGIDVSRLSAVGLGQEHPFESNETEKGRRINRRVEFHLDGGKP